MFYEVGKVYRLAGYDFTIHAVVDSQYGPLAFATFVGVDGIDAQILCKAQFEESQLAKDADACDPA